jgi:hypothetical protein
MRGPEMDFDETRDFCIEVGRTLLMCSLVERHMRHLSRSFNITEWLDFKAADISMNNAINGMKRQYGLEDNFVSILHEFRENRNKFVHETWDLSTARLSDKEGREEALSFIVALYATASALKKVLYPHVIARYEATGQQPPDWKPILLPTPKDMMPAGKE